MVYLIYQDVQNLWRWRLYAANNRIIAESGEGYWNKNDCRSAVDLVASSAGTPVRYQ